ncbi:hypothetical protein SUGI_0296770 [Cryptomeria japonica]|uniref:uncharacterized protein LOC131054201 n=1 Tax=Cryptomeria japonica TaxID=3369 RepID=UPI002408C004|nr:uncharacterized protein LOC131054201 [Cryptomeria japonica]GLJ17149.1 hypothetical protein SUGI_0296770 [Cryptomeria japonica]
MERGGFSSENRPRGRSDECDNWRNKSSTNNTSDTWSSRGRSGSSQSSSWRRTSTASSSSSSDQSWRNQPPSPSNASRGGTSRKSAIKRGKVVTLQLSEGYGFLAPIVPEGQWQQNSSSNVYFRVGENTKTEIGLFELKIGDVLEYITNESAESPRCLYACLVECKLRSLEDLLSYLNELLMHCKSNPERVLQETTKCPAGFLQLLNYKSPPLDLVSPVMELVTIISDYNQAPLYATRLKKFYRLFSGTILLQRSLRELRPLIEENRFINFLARIATHNSQSVAEVLPLLNDMVKDKGGEKLDCHCEFLLHMLTAQAGDAISACNLERSKMQLVPMESEMTDSLTDEASMEIYFKGLPYVKTEGSYGSVEEYMDTYFRLLKEDCFWGLKKGISDLKKNKWDPKDMRVWPNGVLIGFHFGGSYSGLTIAVATERVYSSKCLKEGNLICLSDDGGNFDSPIWGIVAHCEDAAEKMVMIFVEIVEGRGGSAVVEIEAIGRLLAASRIVIAESPTFYKAYQPVLKALQDKDLVNFPFVEELVYGHWPSCPPEYLTPSTTLDWSCLFEKKGQIFPDGSLNDNLKFPTLFPFLRAPVSELDNLLTSGCRMSLDESQTEALKLALSNRLVLIQGPPGTGKTYLGVKLVRLLLTADTLPTGPILVITYKNHGLDNFLLGCLPFCKNLVRVGRRSTELALQDYNLSVKVSRVDEFSSEWTACRHRLQEIQYKMEMALNSLIDSNAFDSETLITHMPDRQLRLLLSKSQSGKQLLENFPEETPLGESIRGKIGESTEARRFTTSLHNAISRQIREWKPPMKTFELVENCFSHCKPQRVVDEILASNKLRRGTEGYSYQDEVEEDPSEDESMEDFWVPGSKRSQDNGSWLENNFFPFKREDDGNLFSKRVNLHIDIDKYRWLLNENPWHLNEHCRVLLVHVIMQTQYELGLKSLADLKKEYDEICEMMKEINQRRQLQVLQEASIVGMTTAGAAMHLSVLKMLRPAIVFVEEASEILEPQVLAALQPSVQHLILIGDHYQLSPSVACYELELWHDFSVSMFERLVEYNKFPFQSLAVQSRMREEFLPMILPIYPHVRSNTELVRGRRNEAPSCITTPMHFWSHTYPETKHENSYANKGESEMVVALLSLMLAEGENPQNITVLAAYNGQVSLLRKKLEGKTGAKDVQVLSIDRFQGSENNIVIVSLVRSNDDRNIGYLARRNRLCIAVSRARGGLYFCGDHNLFLEKSPHWRTLIEYFKERECVSEQMYLRCPRHSCDPPFLLCNKDASSFNPLFCTRPCRAVLECSHLCSSTCHHGEHPPCGEQVLFQFRSCGHEATKRCSQDEETILCSEEISYKFKKCGHTEVFKCWRVMKKQGLLCMHSCPRELECGHPCSLKCYKDCKANPCGICIEIEKEKAAKEKEREVKELSLKKEELKKEISKLKTQNVTEESSISEIDSESETAAEYLLVRDRTEKFIQPKHGILPIVTKIEKVSSVHLKIKFLETQKDLISPTSPTQLLFHGTSDQGIQGIIKKGFELPPPDKQNMFGRGIYFATDSSKSAQQIYTKGSNKLLLCEVLLGRTWTVQQVNPYMAKMDKQQINKKGYDSLFSKRDGKGKGGTLYDEFVVYDPYQAIPRYIVHYKNLAFDPAAISWPISVDRNLTRVQYEMSQNFTGDTPAEYHFRLAESQFFRMSSRNDYKVIKVEHILNKKLQMVYEKAKEELEKQRKSVEEMLVFHGTDKDAIEKIIEEGFKIGGQGVEVRHGTVYGSGVYTALDPHTSINYSRGGMILLSSALIGEKGNDFNEGASSDVLVLHKTEYLLPKYIVHFVKK